MKNVLLIGIYGVYNYGCEAIVRGTASILKSIDPDINITYASYNYDDDVRRLSDLDINIIERRHIKKWSIRNITRKLLSYFNIKYSIPFDDIKAFKSYDYALSIGGDMYTLYHNGSFDKSLPDFMSRLKKQGSKYILWGCSVGPFDKNPEALEYFKSHLKDIDLIVARESETVDYLKKIGISQNVMLAPDPAFFVNEPSKDIHTTVEGSKTFGINFSPLSALYEYGNLDVALREQTKFIKWLIDNYDARIILLPHVITSDYNNDDFEYLKTLYSNLPDAIKERVTLISDDPGFVGLKKHIMKCDMVIAARMHCAINTIACGIPALFLSYSSKAKGMSKFVYGDENNVISLKDLYQTDVIKTKIDNLLTYKLDNNAIKNFDFTKILDNKSKE